MGLAFHPASLNTITNIKQMTKQDELRAILSHLGGGTRAIELVGELLPIRGSPRSVSTVYKWLNGSKHGQDIPDECLELLRIKVGPI